MKNRRATRTIMARALISMAFIAAFACLFNLFPDRVGTYRTVGDRTTFTPILAPVFESHLPALNFWWGLSLLFNGTLLWTRRWTPALRLAEVTLVLLGAFVLGRLVIAGPFLAAGGGTPVRYLLAFAVLGMLVDAVRKLTRLVNGRALLYGPDPARQ